MTILDRYLTRSFVTSYVILVLLAIGGVIVGDVLINFDEFVEQRDMNAGDVLTFMVDYYSYNVLLYYAQLGGPLLAVAAAFTLGGMLRNNELTALIASGMPLQRLTAPIVFSSALLLTVWFVNQEVVIPAVAHKIARDRDDISGARTRGAYMIRDRQGALLIAQRLDPREGVMERVIFITPDADGRPSTVIDADRAEYDAEAQTWRLGERGRYITLEDAPTLDGFGGAFDDRLEWRPIGEYAYGLSPEQLVLFQRAEWAELLSLREMNALVRTPNLPNRPLIVMNRHIRLTQPLIYFILVLLVTPCFLTREPGALLAASGAAVLFGAGLLGLTFVMNGFVNEANAALRVWTPIFVFGPVAVLQLANVRT